MTGWQQDLDRFEDEARRVLAKCGAPSSYDELEGYRARDRLELAAQLIIRNAPLIRNAANNKNVDGALSRLLRLCEYVDEMRTLAAIPEYRKGIYLTGDGWKGVPDIVNDARLGFRTYLDRRAGHEQAYGTDAEKAERKQKCISAVLDAHRKHPRWNITACRQSASETLSKQFGSGFSYRTVLANTKGLKLPPT